MRLRAGGGHAKTEGPSGARICRPSEFARDDDRPFIRQQPRRTARAGPARRRASRPVHIRGALRAGTGTPVAQHLDLHGARQPGPEARRFLYGGHRRLAAGDAAGARRRGAGVPQSMRAQGHPSGQRGGRELREHAALSVPRLDLSPGRQPQDGSDERRLPGNGDLRFGPLAGADAGAQSANLPGIRVRAAQQRGAGFSRLLRRFPELDRQHGRPLAGGPAGESPAACCVTTTTATGRCSWRT